MGKALLEIDFVGEDKLAAGIKDAIGELRYLEAKKKAADLVISVARSRAPVVSGDLRGSLRSDADGKMYSDMPYANPIHWGWASRNIMPNMFLLEAGRQTESEWIQFFEDEVWAAITYISAK